VLKSDQNGIETFRGGEGWVEEDVLKSDQNGIETVGDVVILELPGELKSDQNGIETQTLLGRSILLFSVKIRPKWD